MNRLPSLLLAGLCTAGFAFATHAAESTSAGGRGAGETYAKKAQEDFEMAKKRLMNNYDVAVQKCSHESGQAQNDCRKQAKATLDGDIKRERTVYKQALHSHKHANDTSSGSSGSAAGTSKSGTPGDKH